MTELHDVLGDRYCDVMNTLRQNNMYIIGLEEDYDIGLTTTTINIYNHNTQYVGSNSINDGSALTTANRRLSAAEALINVLFED